jgi:hypothetical protein
MTRAMSYHPPIFNDPSFTVDVMIGWILTVAGALLLLLTSIRFSYGIDGRAPKSPRRLPLRALVALGATMFVGGLLWQVFGYVAVGLLDWKSVP